MPVVAIDGPSGSGKSSTSRLVASHFGWDYLDTGAMYRAAAWGWLQSDIPAHDHRAIADLVAQLDLQVRTDPQHPTCAVEGVDVTAAIREPEISAMVSIVSSIQDVRDILIARQRAIISAAEKGIVAEGRDITTVVAPDADVRILLVADPQARVARRAAELGEGVSADDVTDQVIRRDADDSKVTAFTRAADGVVEIDSTSLNLDQVVATVIELIEARTA